MGNELKSRHCILQLRKSRQPPCRMFKIYPPRGYEFPLIIGSWEISSSLFHWFKFFRPIYCEMNLQTSFTFTLKYILWGREAQRPVAEVLSFKSIVDAYTASVRLHIKCSTSRKQARLQWIDSSVFSKSCWPVRARKYLDFRQYFTLVPPY